MSERTFSRVSRRKTKMTPAEFVQTARLQTARRVSYRCGFGNVDAMRRAFVRNLGRGPTKYRWKIRREFRDRNDVLKSLLHLFRQLKRKLPELREVRHDARQRDRA
ncbi:MAG: helix-turn-helix domain-containing protein [Alphaproteobacteria bacterium]|nr:MAG: helix-turn-helix domain-containing protein [Alphaproteobacteria bacterium]